MPIARIRSLAGAFGPLLREIFKFGVVGVANVVVDAAIFNLLLLLLLPGKPLTDKAISTTVAIVSSYFMNRHWTWRDRPQRGLGRELPLFFVLSVIGLLIAEVCLAVSHYLLGLRSPLADNVSANIVGLALGMVFRFWSYRRWVFPAPVGETDDPG